MPSLELAVRLLTAVEIRRVMPRYARSLISPAILVVLSLFGGARGALFLGGLGVILALSAMAVPLRISDDRRDGFITSLSLLPLSGYALAAPRLLACVAFCSIGAALAAVLAAIAAPSMTAIQMTELLRPSLLIRVLPILILGSWTLCAIAARFSMVAATTAIVLIGIVASRIPMVGTAIRKVLLVDSSGTLVVAGALVLAIIVAVTAVSIPLLARALQPRHGA